MSKEIYISSTPQETRLAIVENNDLNEIYYERENEYTLAGSIYNGKVTRVLPGMQSSFVDIGLERDAFLYITDFMEEQGDAADFESGERSSGRREAGKEGGRSESRRESRGDGRGERNGRGRRDRGERKASPEAGDGGEERDEPGFAGDPVDAAPRADGDEEIGEGAPGADGSRRWRGRRGRRRGRPGENGAVARSEEPRSTEPTIVRESDGFDDEPAAAAPEARETRAVEGGRERGGDERRGEGRRGRRDRGDRGGESREGRDDSRRHAEVRDRFAPRGLRTGGREEEESVDLSASAAEPFILPGESLSKYRRGEEGAAEAAASAKPAPAAPARPSTEMPALSGWDGGAVLPGETLSRRGGGGESASSQRGGRESGREAGREGGRDAGRERGGDDRGRDRRRERDERRGRRREIEPSEAVQPAVTSEHEPEAMTTPMYVDAVSLEAELAAETIEVQDRLSTEEPLYEPVTDDVQAYAVETPAVVEEAVEEFHETVSEYEPGEDSAVSYRVDPAGPSEFRQSTPSPDEFVALEERADEERAHEEAAFEARMSDAPQEHSFTTVQATGDMISDVEDVVAPRDSEVPSAPMEHERAVQGVHLSESEGTPMQSQEFAPGDGQLEEELLDDEEESFSLQGSAMEDEDTEEETLEGAADLGSMLEDLSLDALVHPDALDEDEDEDEEELDFDDEEMEEDELSNGEELAGSEMGEAEEGEYGSDADVEDIEDEDEAAGEEGVGEAPAQPGTQRERERGGRDRGDRGGRERRGGRDRERSGGRDRRGMAGSRSGGRPSRQSAQLTDLPAISDLLKPGQEVLVQIAKEPIAKKGARITSHIALPGRFLVFMPTVNHVGVSRKIDSDGERRRLKEILLSEKGDASGGFIVRTAASGASEEELRSDLRFLLNLWADIKQRSESSKSPALIYHDLNLVERILRDQVTDNFSAIWVDTEDAYERVLRFLQRFQPSLIRRVKLYTKETPLFEQFGIQEEINKALRSKVWLKSGGSIVINQTEALVAIDINTGKYVGKTARLEDTIVKTNLDAIPEIVRQIRLRDLGGIIVIDFIDMDERKNRHKVLAALEEELKKDRAPSKVLQFNDFGLVAITRKRVKQSLERTLSIPCNICAGTGMVKSPVTVCNEVYIELRKMYKHIEKADIMLRVNPEVVKQLKANGGKWLQEMEEMSGKTILVKSDPSLHPEQFDLH